MPGSYPVATVKSAPLAAEDLLGFAVLGTLKAAKASIKAANYAAKATLALADATLELVADKTKQVLLAVALQDVVCVGMNDEAAALVLVVANAAKDKTAHLLVARNGCREVFRAVAGACGLTVPFVPVERADKAKLIILERTPRPAAPAQAAVQNGATIDSTQHSVFEAWYLGCVPVKKRIGEDVAGQAVDFLKKHAKSASTPEAEEAAAKPAPPKKTETSEQAPTPLGNRVNVVVSSEGLRIIDVLTRGVIQSTFIKNISFATVFDEGKELEQFAYISYDDHLDRSCCFALQCLRGLGDQMCRSIGDALDRANEDLEAAQGPFVDPTATACPMDIPAHFMRRHLPRECLVSVKPIGVGKFGKVYLATFLQMEDAGALGDDVTLLDDASADDKAGDGGSEAQSDDTQLAVKLLRSTATDVERLEFMAEAEITATLDHINVTKLLGCCFLEQPWLIVQQFMQYGNLHSAISALREKGITLTTTEQLMLAKQIAAGEEYILSQGVLHLDLALRNCLLHTANVVKIGDFSIAKRFDAGTDKFVLKERLKLSLRWLAVETFTSDIKVFSAASEGWAFGVVLWEIASYAATPYGKLRLQDVHRLVPRGLRLPRPEGCSEPLYNLMCSCWTASTAERPAFSAMLSTLSSLYDEAVAIDGAPRDIGQTLNGGLTRSLIRLGKRASIQFRRTSLSFSRSPSTGDANYDPQAAETLQSGAQLGLVRRKNPLFSEAGGELSLSSFAEEEEEEEKAEDGANVDETADAAEPPKAPAAQPDSAAAEQPPPTEGAQPAAKPTKRRAPPPPTRIPTNAFVVGDPRSAPSNSPSRPPKNPPSIVLRSDGSMLSGSVSRAGGQKLPFQHTHLIHSSAKTSETVLIVPKKESAVSRRELLQKRPSRESLKLDPDVFVPEVGAEGAAAAGGEEGADGEDGDAAVELPKRDSNDSLNSVNLDMRVFS